MPLPPMPHVPLLTPGHISPYVSHRTPGCTPHHASRYTLRHAINSTPHLSLPHCAHRKSKCSMHHATRRAPRRTQPYSLERTLLCTHFIYAPHPVASNSAGHGPLSYSTFHSSHAATRIPSRPFKPEPTTVHVNIQLNSHQGPIQRSLKQFRHCSASGHHPPALVLVIHGPQNTAPDPSLTKLTTKCPTPLPLHSTRTVSHSVSHRICCSVFYCCTSLFAQIVELQRC